MSICILSCDQIQTSRGLEGNNIIEFVQHQNDKKFYTDPIDDTINFTKESDYIYKGKDGKLYIQSVCFRPIDDDTLLYQEYFQEITDFLDPKTYGRLKGGYFQNKGKVYMWWANSDGQYPVEVVGADPKSFVPFDSVAGGIDKNFVFYGGPPGKLEIIKGANPKVIRVLNPRNGCWNCGNCYFADDKSVFYGLTRIKVADPNTFVLINKARVDAVDKHGKYFEGQIVK